MNIKITNILLSNYCVQGTTQRAFHAFSHLLIRAILWAPTAMIHSFLQISKWRQRGMKHLPKDTQPTHSPELASHWPHCTTSTRLPLTAKGCSQFTELVPSWGLTLFSLPCVRKEWKGFGGSQPRGEKTELSHRTIAIDNMVSTFPSLTHEKTIHSFS